MRRTGAIAVVGLAAILAVFWLVLVAWDTDRLPTALLGGAVLGLVITGIGFRLAGRPPRAAGAGAVPDLSFGAVGLAAGIAALVLGAEVGLWLLLIGAGVTAGALAQLARERRARRTA